MLLIPYATDAPIYYWPKATVGLILVNFASYFLISQDALAIQFGTLNPLQWLTSLFAHAHIWHLVGNMIFLWAFGIIVEGKIGWWKFLLIYLTIGMTESAIGQVLMLNNVGQALGASAAIYGLIAIAVIWAPENNLEFKYIIVLFFYPFVGTFEVSLLIVGFFYIASDFFWMVMTQFQMSSYFAHFTGALVGAGIGVAMIKWRRVDCEGFDLISMMNGKFGEKPPPTVEQVREQKINQQKLKSALNLEATKLKNYIQQGHYEMAELKLRQIRKKNRNYQPSAQDLWALINGLIQNKKFSKGINLMEDYINWNPHHKNMVLLNMSKVYCQLLDQPRMTIKTLDRLDSKEMDAKQKSLAHKIKQLAFKKFGELGVDDPVDDRLGGAFSNTGQ